MNLHLRLRRSAIGRTDQRYNWRCTLLGHRFEGHRCVRCTWVDGVGW